MKKSTISLLFALTSLVFARFSIKSDAPGKFSIYRDDTLLIDNVSVETNSKEIPDLQHSHQTMPDGTDVWNTWSENRECRTRLELALRPDNTVEITMMGFAEAMQENRMRTLALYIPENLLLGKHFDCLRGNGRTWNPGDGTFAVDMKPDSFRWLCADGLTWDFNPIGSTDYAMQYTSGGTLKGVWNVKRQNGHFMIYAGQTAREQGGFLGTKVVLREGKNEDYSQIHLIKQYQYPQHLLPSHLFYFGKGKTGKQYTNGNVVFSEDNSFGWTDGIPQNTSAPMDGALYNFVADEGENSFKVSNIAPGYYVCTVFAGNYTATDNNFSISINDQELISNLAVASKKLWSGSRVIFAKDSLNFHFSGRYQVSAIGIQPLLGKAEDYSMTRGILVSDGYEPCPVYGNSDFAGTPYCPPTYEIQELPEQGTECDAEYRQPPRPVKIPSPDSPQLAWLKNRKCGSIGIQLPTCYEWQDPALRKKYFDKQLANQDFNSVMFGYMHSRHTFPTHIEKLYPLYKELCDDFHARGLAVIDHHDSTLLWNINSGLRVLAERIGELGRAVDDDLPTFQFCPNNPVFKQTYFEYLRKLVELGADGFQIDELQFWPHTCLCQHCRSAFQKETGWIYPLNELDPERIDSNSRLNRCWFDWKMASITNWFIDLRTYLEDIKPDLVLSAYTTHWGMLRSQPGNKAGFDLLDECRVMNCIGTEVMTRDPFRSSRPLLPLRRMMNMIETAYGIRPWGIYYPNDWQNYCMSNAISNMVGHGPIMSVLSDNENAVAHRNFMATDANMQRDGAKRQAKIALLFSRSSRDYNRYIGFEPGLFGLAQELEEMHIPYEILCDVSLTPENLSNFEILSLGSSACLSDSALKAAMDFAQAGGTLYMTTATALCDEKGYERDEWPFASLFGFTPVYATRTNISDMNGVVPNTPIRNFIPNNQEQNTFYEERAFGMGKIIYCAADIAQAFYTRECTAGAKWPHEIDASLDKVYKEYLAGIFGKAAIWQCQAPAQVYTALWKQSDGTTAIHFLNATGVHNQKDEVFTGEAPDNAYPTITEDISFKLTADNIISATAYSPDFSDAKELELKQLGNRQWQITLPADCLKIYTIVKIR